jgi:hypothetical protein
MRCTRHLRLRYYAVMGAARPGGGVDDLERTVRDPARIEELTWICMDREHYAEGRCAFEKLKPVFVER